LTSPLAFRVLATDGLARAGEMTTAHGVVPTPTFMPVGTQGAVKTLTPAEVAATGARIVLGNTYHLWLRPGAEAVAAHGGLHAFTRWPHAMLTDSGGFQAFSLAERRTVSEDGFVFRSHLDGSRHAAELGELPFEGLALGGFSVGEPIETMHAVLPDVAPALDAAWPRYLMGVGTPRDLVIAIGAGVDMFDCVLPTRNARNGQALLREGRVVIKQARYKDDREPIDPSCGCPACRGGYARSYLRHLYLSGEILALRLFSEHNLHLYGQLVAEARAAIGAGTYASFRERWARAGVGDREGG